MKLETECDCNILHNEILEKVKKEMPNTEQIFELADFFKIFGDSTRANIICALDKNTMCICDIANLLDMTKSEISHQLKILRDNNIVKYKKKGKEIFYSLAD